MIASQDVLGSSANRSLADRVADFVASHEGMDPDSVLRDQYDAGLAWPHFRVGWGGAAVDRASAKDTLQRLREAGMPSSPASFVGLNQVAALLHQLNRVDLRDRFLRRIFTGADQWCQLFSEPGAGSDLANVGTMAISTADGWSLTGQKVWTSNALHADFALALARTDPDAPKHRGLSLFVLDMHSPGVEVRPLRQADGSARFSEVFLDAVPVPDGFLLGDVGQGWALAMSVLSDERDSASAVFRRPVGEVVDRWRDRAHRVSEDLRDEVLDLWVCAQVLELNARRQEQDPGAPGAVRLGAIAKVAASEHAQRHASTLAAVVGPEILVQADYEKARQAEEERSAAAVKNFAALSPHRFLLRSRAMSIEGGTNEISRNVIGERVLGLPRDVRVDKDVAWRLQKGQ